MTGGSGRPVAVVTGGSRGIGAATCEELARRGYAVHLVHRADSEAAAAVTGRITAASGLARAWRCDVGDPEAVEDFAAALEDAEDRLDVLVNNAGVTDDALLLSTSPQQWDAVLRTNLTGPFLMTRALAPLMMDRRRGVIVNVSSNSARIPGPGQAAYAAAKGGVEALTRAMAVELGRVGIRVNCVAPGRVRTGMTEPVAGRMNAMGDAPWGTPAEIAQVIAFLASEDAAYVSGQVLTADGGLAITRPQAHRAGPR